MSGKPQLDIGRVTVREDASIGVTFSQGRIYPRVMTVAGRGVTVAAIAREWTGNHHGAILHYLLITDEDAGAWKLCFIAPECRWMVEEIPRPVSAIRGMPSA